MEVKTLEQQIVDLVSEMGDIEAEAERYKQFFQMASACNQQLRKDIDQLKEENTYLLNQLHETEEEKSRLEMELEKETVKNTTLQDEMEFLEVEVNDLRETLLNE